MDTVLLWNIHIFKFPQSFVSPCNLNTDWSTVFYFQAVGNLIMTEPDQEPIKFEDVKDEIFDMAKPKDPARITLQDLIDW